MFSLNLDEIRINADLINSKIEIWDSSLLIKDGWGNRD